MAIVRPGNEERAWNDPPQFAYHQDSQTSMTKRLLNKRVPFPQTLIPEENEPSSAAVGTLLPTVVKPGKGEVTNSGVVLLPPSSTTSVPPTCPTVLIPTEGTHILPDLVSDATGAQDFSTVGKTAESDENVSEEEMLSILMSVLDTVLNDLSGKIQKRIQEDINRRITVLNCVWKEKLSLHVKKMMYQLAKAISAGNYEMADSIHRSLMVDYVSEVSQWMVGIKHIIHEAKQLNYKESETCASDEEQLNKEQETLADQPVPVLDDSVQ